MKLQVGDMVSRNSYGNDIVFRILKIDNNVAYLKGVDLRLYADSLLEDLIVEENFINEDKKIIRSNLSSLNLDRSEFFYLPGRIVHIDGDDDYLSRCLEFYKQMGVKAKGFRINESDMANSVHSILEEYNPAILVITGHDAYFSKKNNKENNNNYQNTKNFINAVVEARNYEKSQDKLIIIAGACQSNYEGLILAGANFASSPKRINIHALDPAIVATSISLSEKNKELDILSLIKKTKYKEDGFGGIITNGTMYVGYPR